MSDIITFQARNGHHGRAYRGPSPAAYDSGRRPRHARGAHVNAQGGKPYAGTTINGSCFQTTYFEYLKTYFPQFEERTGIKVNFNMQAFPVYNQRTDLELSTKGSALDVINCTFIYSGRWIGAGWMTNLDTFTKDAKYTPAAWDAGGFRRRPNRR